MISAAAKSVAPQVREHEAGTTKRWPKRIALIFLVVTFGCVRGEQDDGAPLHSSLVRSDTLVEIRLDVSLNQIALHAPLARDLEPVVELSGADLDMGTVADARFFGQGSLAVLDRRSRHVLVLDQETWSYRQLGRRGPGPGEFAAPWAMAAVGSHLLVLQTGDPVFILFDSVGQYVRSTARPIKGDWRNPVFRAPSLRADDFQNSPEDVERRLRADGDSGFFHILQPNESPMGEDSFDLAAPPAYVVRYGLDLQVRDTVAVMRAPGLTRGKVYPGGWQDYEQDMFASWPLIATGNGWIAFAHGDSAVITVRRTSPVEERMLVRWPDDRPEITENDKDSANNWLMQDAFRRSADFERRWNDLPRGRRRQLLEEQKNERLRFSEHAPNITSLHGSGSCLFATGFNAADRLEGIARTIVAINVETGRTDVIRVTAPEETVRDFSPNRMVATRRDDNGEWYIRIYEHGVACRSDSP